MKEAIAAIREYLEYFPKDYIAKDNLMRCEYAEELGYTFDEMSSFYIEHGRLKINSQIAVGKWSGLTNSTTGYEFNNEDILVIWSEPCGRLAFIDNMYWFDVAEEWDEFMGVLKSYEPLDYDYLNNNYVYDVEHGRKLIDDYDKIVEEFMAKARQKIKGIELAKKKERLKQLQEELENYDAM